MPFDLDIIADTYLRHCATKRDEDFWAWQEVNRIVRSRDVNQAWEVTQLLLRKAETDGAVGCVAAGPLEDFVDAYGNEALDRLEQACDENARLQFALSGIWLLPDSPVLQRWQGLMVKYGFATGKRKPAVTPPRFLAGFLAAC